MLYEFVILHREELIRRCKAKVASRAVPTATPAEIEHGVPLFLDQLVSALRLGHTQGGEIGQSAVLHGQDLLAQGFTVSQVVHDYGDVCQSITELAVESAAPIGTNDFRVLNACLDNAIASAVTEFGRERKPTPESAAGAAGGGGEHIGFLTHELRDLINTVILAFDVLKTGYVGVGGSTGKIIDRSLLRLRVLISRSLADVRLKEGVVHLEDIPVGAFAEELAESGRLEANARDIGFAFRQDRAGAVMKADRQLLAMAVMNLLHNALKFTRPGTTVTLNVRAEADRVLIEVLDECGGIQGGDVERLFSPFTQQSANREGLGLGLALTQKTIEAIGGRISVRNMPPVGCMFTIELPRVIAPAQAAA